MKTNETKAILNLPALRVLCFKNIGRYAELGLNFQDALGLFDRDPPLRSISCSDCINVKSVPTQLSATDAWTFFSAILIRQIEGATFNVHLSECGTEYLPGVHPNEPQVLPGFSDEFVMDEQIFPMEEDEDEEPEEDAEEEEMDEDEEEADEAEAEDEDVEIDQPNALDALINAEDIAVQAGAGLAAAAVAEAIVPANMFLNLVNEEEIEDEEAEDAEADDEDNNEEAMDVDEDGEFEVAEIEDVDVDAEWEEAEAEIEDDVHEFNEEYDF